MVWEHYLVKFLIVAAQWAQLQGALLVFSSVSARRWDLTGMAADSPGLAQAAESKQLPWRTSDRSVSPVRSQCKSDLLTISASSRQYYRRKAEQVVDVVLDAIAPGNSTWLFKQVRSKHNIIQGVSNVGEGMLVSRLVTCYEEAGSWYNRQQILSLFAGDYSKTELL